MSSTAGACVGTEHPVMALLPTPGNVDLLIASELLEAGRAAERGMITPDRTTVIASTHRTFAIAEKGAMGDGRFDDDRVQRAVRELACRHVLEDLGSVAEGASTVLSSVLLGAAAGSGALPHSARTVAGGPSKRQESRWRQISGASMPRCDFLTRESTRRHVRPLERGSSRESGAKPPGSRPLACRRLFLPASMRFPVRSGVSPGWAWREPWTSRTRATAGSTWIGSSACSAGCGTGGGRGDDQHIGTRYRVRGRVQRRPGRNTNREQGCTGGGPTTRALDVLRRHHSGRGSENTAFANGSRPVRSTRGARSACCHYRIPEAGGRRVVLASSGMARKNCVACGPTAADGDIATSCGCACDRVPSAAT